MTLTNLAIRGVRHYWRTNLATALGLATAAAVMAGAIAVGESVRESLRELAFSRIGRTDRVLVSNGFFREALAPGAPMIALEAVVTHDESGRRASRVALYAVDRRFWEFHQRSQQPPRAGEVLLSPALAQELGAKPDDGILVRVPQVSAIPAESLHGRKDDPGRTLRARMREVIAREAMGEFSLRPTQGEVRAVFLPLDRVQREFEREGRVNTVLLSGPIGEPQLADLGIRLRGNQLEHESIVIDDYTAETVRSVDPESEPVFTYLANTIRVDDKEVPYSLIAAMDRPDLPDDNSIVLNEWAARELGVRTGNAVQIEYYLWDPSGRLVTQSETFDLAAIVPVNPDDRTLAPEYPGISGAESVSDWDPPFPIELKRIRKQDEEYWDKYKATPKAYIRLAAGQKLWGSRYGAVTSIRVSDNFSPEKLRKALDPERAGLTVVNAREQAVAASRGSTDFGEYFGYFSFFLLISALLLAVLFFRFGLEQRAGEIATLRALGYGGKALRKLFLTEGLLLAIVGGIIGIAGAALYGAFIVTGLTTWWVDAVGTRELRLHFGPAAVITALATSVVVGVPVIWFSLRSILKREVRTTVVRGQTPRIIAWVALVAGIGLLFVGGPGGFFGAGASLLTAFILFLYTMLPGVPGAIRDVRGLGLRYTAHRPGRSVLCVALIASATFLIVAIDAFRRDGHTTEGPWRWFAESAIPVYHDPNTPAGREALNLQQEAKWLPFRLRPGDDASCLNLYAPRNPRVLGVPASYLKIAPGSAAVDANTLQYALHKKIGDTIEVGGAKFTIGQALNDSVFQSEVLISDADFQKSFPEEGGYRVFLIDAPEGADTAIEKALSDYGLDVTSTAARRAAFHRVENTYLSTFQALGGLGLVIGTIGLAAVLLRNVLERRRELALLRAVGYGPAHLTRMTISENVFLLVAGLAIGTVCALVAVLPTVIARGGSPPVLSILALLGTVLAVGLLASFLAVRVINRAPLLDALRSE